MLNRTNSVLPSIVKLLKGGGVGGNIAGNSLGGSRRLPYKNADFAQVVIGKRNTTRLATSPTRGSRPARHSDSVNQNWHPGQLSHPLQFRIPDLYVSWDFKSKPIGLATVSTGQVLVTNPLNCSSNLQNAKQFMCEKLLIHLYLKIKGGGTVFKNGDMCHCLFSNVHAKRLLI